MTTYLITGSSRGLGLAFASQLAALPNTGTIFATSRSETPALKSLIEKSKGKVVGVKLEATDKGSIKSAVKEVEGKLEGKGLGVLINNAGIMDWSEGGASGMHADELDRILHTNVTGMQMVSQAFLPLLQKGSEKKIINITSTLGSIAMVKGYEQSQSIAYKISKAALNMLTAQWAMQHAANGFTIACLSPGWLKTDLGGVEYADLEVEVGAKAALDQILNATKEDNGKFLNIHVKGYENVASANKYDGKSPPW